MNQVEDALEIGAACPEERPVPGLPDYLVTSDGRVVSLKYGRRMELRQGRAGRGYRVVKPCRDGENVTRYVHQLVCEAFHGPRPAGLQARHIDTDMENNLASNLAWGTPEQNRQDSHDHGKYQKGTDRPLAKLDVDKVRVIRRLVALGQSAPSIARQFGVAKSQVWSIKNGKTWRHVA